MFYTDLGQRCALMLSSEKKQIAKGQWKDGCMHLASWQNPTYGQTESGLSIS